MAAPWEEGYQEPKIPEIGAQIPVTPQIQDTRARYPNGRLSDPWEYTKDAAMQTGSALDDLVRMIANGFTAGGADVLAGNANAALGIDGKGGQSPEGQQFQSELSADALGPVLSTGGQIAGAGAQALLTPNVAMSTIPRAAVTGLGMSTANTAAQSYFNDGTLPSLPELIPGAIFGTIAGAGGAALGKVLQQPRLNPAKAKNADILQKEGVDITAGQASGDFKMMRQEGAANGAWEFIQKQGEQFSKAALKRANIISDTGHVDEATLNAAFAKTGEQMDALAARNNLIFKAKFDPDRGFTYPLLDEVRGIAEKYRKAFGTNKAPIIDETVSEISKAIKEGVLTGQKFQEITSGLGDAARANKDLTTTAHEMRMALANAMEDYIVSTNSADAGLWKAVNRQYSNQLIIENALGRAGAASGEGLITPQSLGAATKAVRGTRAFVRGRTDMDELAKAGAAAMKPLNIQSMNPQALMSYITSRIATATPALAGVGYGMAGGSPALAATAIGGSLAGMGINALRNTTRLTPFSALSPTATASGGAMGAALGAAAGPEIPQPNNPFTGLGQ